MGIALMFLLALYQMQSAIHSEIIESPNFGSNALLESDTDADQGSSFQTGHREILQDAEEKPDQTELEFRYPISAIGIDYARNSVILRFQKHGRRQRLKYDPELEAKRRSLQDNFMHFGKRQAEQMPPEESYGSDGEEGMVKRSDMDRYSRDPKQDFMRFGRVPKQDFMRFGRDPKQDFMRFGRDPSDFMRFGRTPSDFMRFGRTPSDFMRFGRTPSDFMRFGRSDNFMRLGRSSHEELRSPKQDFMRFGRPDNFMRFGRSAPPEFERYGKMDSNFMRFGKSSNPAAPPASGAPESNQTKSQPASNQPGERSPVDKAMTILFRKQEQQRQSKSGEQTEHTAEGGSVEQEQFYGQ
ncbi:FMRFamide-related peptides [Drosophila pseudoobscura]|uniref:FMRFamide-related peptides n=1 Tax=Drosophila pseudoobscura pseudoobscura TaxID=46245 RepID=A0A6I8UV14_DROPS|nr:FMRFamide-related peptides [Drosophila pseudoobscura]